MPKISPSAHQHMTEYVVNPKSGRLVKIYSKKYYQLVKDKFLDVDYDDRKHNILYEGPHVADVKKNMKTDDNSTLHITGDKIVKQRRKVTQDELIDNVIVHAIDILTNHMDKLNPDLSDADHDEIIKNLVHNSLVGNE